MWVEIFKWIVGPSKKEIDVYLNVSWIRKKADGVISPKVRQEQLNELIY